MQPTASHLSLSRHGIWYFRWRVPADVRARHPELPKELKRSTKTADTRRARTLAREMHCAFLLKYGVNMSSFQFSGFTVKRDAVTARITEISTDASDTPDSLAVLARMVEQDNARVSLPTQTGAVAEIGGPAARPEMPQAASDPSPTISVAVERWRNFQLQNVRWTENTANYVHLPSLNLFREMVGVRVSETDATSATTIDLPLSQLTRVKLETFIDELWRYPGQQGMHHTGRTAREIFEAGGTPQSAANVYKRLGHIHLFLKFCRKKGYVTDELVREIGLVLEENTARSQERAAEALAGEDGVAADGYLSFTKEEIRELFGPEFVKRARSNAARYWIPLLSRFTGLRVNEASQLRPTDIVFLEGVHCVHVKGEVNNSPKKDTRRVKTSSSRRIVPLHPKLVELGFLDYVAERLARRADWMWDGLLWNAKSGFGKYPSRDFQKLAEATGVYQARRKVFHSFRSTIAQELRALALEGDLIDQLLGHHSKSIRNEFYGRNDEGRATPVQRMFEVIKLVEPGLDIPPWRAILAR